MSEPRTVTLADLPIELCQLLKFEGLADTGGAAKVAITAGEVLVNGEVETRKRKKIFAGDTVTWKDDTLVVQAE
jgi:ribosome-associated protein